MRRALLAQVDVRVSRRTCHYGELRERDRLPAVAGLLVGAAHQDELRSTGRERAEAEAVSAGDLLWGDPLLEYGILGRTPTGEQHQDRTVMGDFSRKQQ